jgi:hypothetical protein
VEGRNLRMEVAGSLTDTDQWFRYQGRKEGKDEMERIEVENGRQEGETYETQVNIRLFD